MEVNFLKAHLSAFETLSSDRNPLHNDPVYARSTQFGQPVVYGMCAVLIGLGHWAGTRAFRITRIRGKFAQPLFESANYDLRISEKDDQAKVEFRKGGVVHLVFSFSWKPNRTDLHGVAGPQGDVEFRPLASANTCDLDLNSAVARCQNLNFPYSIVTECLPQLLPVLGLQVGQLPVNQLNTLMGLSYLVGMEIPGRQALFSSFELDFDASSPRENQCSFSNVTASLDARFNRISLSGTGVGFNSFAVSAFCRPLPVQYDIANLQKTASSCQAFGNKVVFVSGATRGFGAVLAKLFALEGAEVFVNFRSSSKEAETIVNELRPWNQKVYPVRGDVEKTEDCAGIRSYIQEQSGRIDLLLCNAFPQIPAIGFLQQNNSEFLRFVQTAISATASPLRELLPLVPKGGIVVLISTCYTRDPQPQFSHYIASKSFLESLWRSLALEFPGQIFVIARPPRMLTDQTNLAFDLSPPASALTVGHALIRALGDLRSNANLIEIDLPEN